MKTLHKFGPNQHGRDFVVGDIHGMYSYLMDQLKDLNFDKGCDRLFSVGDLIDRGPESEKCLSLFYEPWFFAVKGNHEQMMIESLVEGLDPSLWFQNGGAWFVHVQDEQAVRDCAEDLSERLPLGIEVETKSGKLIGIVHADVYFHNWDLNFITRGAKIYNTLMWSRSRINGKPSLYVKGIDRLYVGHTPDRGKRVIDNVHYIDCGACFAEGYMHIEEIK